MSLQLELQTLWTCGSPLHEGKGISQAAFSAVKCHYLGHMAQIKRLPGATPSPWQRGVPPVTQSCCPLWHHTWITLSHLCMWGGCILCLLQYISPWHRKWVEFSLKWIKWEIILYIIRAQLSRRMVVNSQKALEWKCFLWCKRWHVTGLIPPNT